MFLYLCPQGLASHFVTLKIFMAVVSLVLGVNVVMYVGSHVNVDNVIIT